jgi:Tfp pilus assembly protein PilV
MDTKYKISDTSGQLLIEAMIAIGVVTFGLLGVFSLLSQSMGLNKVAADQYVGAYLASEGIEVVKNIIDTNIYQSRAWNDGVSDGTYAVQYDTKTLTSTAIDTPLKFDPATGMYNYSVGADTNFKRSVKITSLRLNSQNQPDELQVDSVVTWNGRGGMQYKINLENHFLNWR